MELVKKVFDIPKLIATFSPTELRDAKEGFRIIERMFASCRYDILFEIYKGRGWFIATDAVSLIRVPTGTGVPGPALKEHEGLQFVIKSQDLIPALKRLRRHAAGLEIRHRTDVDELWFSSPLNSFRNVRMAESNRTFPNWRLIWPTDIEKRSSITFTAKQVREARSVIKKFPVKKKRGARSVSKARIEERLAGCSPSSIRSRPIKTS